MITANVFHRIFWTRNGNSTGAAFAIDIDNRQYIISARHVVLPLATPNHIDVFHNDQWNPIRVRTVGDGPDDVDVAVLAANQRLTPTHPLPLPATSNGSVMGQEVYFLGFPFNHYSDVGPVNANFPLPFVKRAIISGMNKATDATRIWYLDGINNPGFSGGPVVWTKHGRNEYNVLSVVSGYRAASEPVKDAGQPTSLTYSTNTGIIVSYDIKHALDLIRANPIGFDLA